MTLIRRNGLRLGVAVFGGLLILLAGGYVLISDEPLGPKDTICQSSAYRSVKNNMNKDEVTALLGAPTVVRVKKSSDQDFYSQGPNEAKIKEGWAYSQEGRSYAAEIYFGSDGYVNGKNCGQG